MKSIKILTCLSWFCQAGIIILTGVQTHSVNLKMALFIVIVPPLVNLPIVINGKQSFEKILSRSMVLISLLAYLALLILMIIFPGKYLAIVRNGIVALSSIGMVVSLPLLFSVNRSSKK